MLVLLDLDGTLFQAKSVIRLAVQRLFQELGLLAPDDDRMLKTAPQGTSVMLRDLLGAEADVYITRYESLLCEAITGCGEAFPGVFETVKQLFGEGHELVVCSNSPEGYINLVLERIGISGYITRFFSAELYPSKTELIRELTISGVPAVVIGDTHRDIEAAHKNGLPAIAATYGYGNKQLLASADYFAHSAAEIVSCVHSAFHSLSALS